MMTLFDTISQEKRTGAVISPCGQYRYHLWRIWNEDLPTMVWVMLNPSTADATEDDPTIRRCIGFAKREGCGSISVKNVFALRSTDPSALAKHADPIGPDNYNWLIHSRGVSLLTISVAGWGARRPEKRLATGYKQAEAAMRICDAYCFGKTKGGDPRHPLYLPKNADKIAYR